MRNLAIIEQMGFGTVAAPCSSCYSRFKSAVHTVAERPDIAADIEKRTKYRYRGTVNVLHLLDLLVDHVGLARVSEHVRRPLRVPADTDGRHDKTENPKSKIQNPERPLRVACYYGCLLTRPPRITGAEHPEYPVKMDQLMRALGAEPVDWSYKTECCGAALGITRTAVAVKLSARILQNAHDCGADVIAAACPLCHVNLDARQAQAGLDFKLPVLYLSQLMAVAFGMDEQAALDKNMVDPRALFQYRVPSTEYRGPHT
jgi:heterodisulfide reductase subunit B